MQFATVCNALQDHLKALQSVGQIIGEVVKNRLGAFSVLTGSLLPIPWEGVTTARRRALHCESLEWPALRCHVQGRAPLVCSQTPLFSPLLAILVLKLWPGFLR